MPRVLSVYKQIAELRERYYRISQDRQSLIELINHAEIPEHVYNSNAIENSTLTLDETEKILQQIHLDRYITDRESFEAKNLAKVVKFIESKSKERELDFDMILLLHKMLLSNINDDVAGRFRKENEWVKVGSYIAPDPKSINTLLKNMLIEYNASVDKHIIKRIALFHLTFEHIHPFVDGNGRIGRVLINYLLIREGYVPINIKFTDRAAYYDAFSEFDKAGKTSIMERIVGRALTNSYHKRLAYMEGKKIITLAEYAKIEKISHSNAINKAHRQTIEAFLERGIWKIGV